MDKNESKKTFFSFFHEFDIVTLDNGKVVGIYIDPINIMPNGEEIDDEYFYINYVYMEDGEVVG